MSLTKVYLDILQEINNNPISINTLVDKYKITARAIRYYINNINYYLKKYNITEINIKKGKLYFYLDNNALADFIKTIPTNYYILSQEERQKYILFNFLFKNNVNISKLERLLNVSRTTIKNDINNLKPYLKKFELYFYMNSNKIILGGKEKKLRYLKYLHMLEYININEDKINYIEVIYPNEKMLLKILKEYLSKININEVYSIVSNVEYEFKSKFSKNFKNTISIYLIATIERIQNGYIIKQKNNADFLIKLPEYKKMKKIINNIVNKNNIKENYKYEILHLTESFLTEYYNKYFYENKLRSEKFILKTLKTLNIKIEEDLVEELIQYIIPSIYRVKHNFYSNIILDFNKSTSAFYQKINEAIEINMSYLEEPLRKEEIYCISKIIENYIYPYNKISLKELSKVIKNSPYNKNILINNIKNKFSRFIENDIECDINILDFLKKKNIILNNDTTFEILLETLFDNLLKSNYINNTVYIKKLINNFGEYFFIKEKIFLLSNVHINMPNLNNKSNIYIIISKNPIKVNKKELNILFFIMAKNKSEHFKIILEIIQLSEYKNFLEEIISENNINNIISKITDIYNNIKNIS